ncbi:MAG: hypothetical protein AMXMBFR56_62190 [Polyangiaceae bacterium]
MIRTTVESPLAAPTPEGFRRNVRYAQLCLLDSLKRGEAPYASHLLYPQVYDDLDEDQRRVGMAAGLEWLRMAELVALYIDLGVSRGMTAAAHEAVRYGKATTQRRLVGRSGCLFTAQSALDAALLGNPTKWGTRLG